MDLVAKLKKKVDVSYDELRLTFSVYEDVGGTLNVIAAEEFGLNLNPDSQWLGSVNGFNQVYLDAEVAYVLLQIEKRLNPKTGSGKSDLSQVDLTIGTGARVIPQKKSSVREAL